MAPNTVSEHRVLLDLQEDNGFFDFVVDMIPAKVYVSSSSNSSNSNNSNSNNTHVKENSQVKENKKYFRGQAKESKEAKRAKAKQAKRARLDPEQMESTTQLKKRLQGGRDVLPTAAPQEDKASSAKKTNNMSRIEALRAKLHAKIESKRSQRPENPNAISKRAARRAEKKRRQDEAVAKKNRKSAHTKTSSSHNASTAELFQVGKKNKKNDAATMAQDLANMDFGRLAGLNANDNAANYIHKNNKSLANMKKTKNLQKMLADAEAKREKLERLKRSTDDADKQKAMTMEWSDTFKEASGERVKDDPAKIKKAMKRKAAQKAKSAKAWKTRTDQTKDKMDERQKIRNHNLKKRMVGGQAGANLSKKRIVLADDTPTNQRRGGDDRRLSRSGFEGKKLEFLNTKTSQ